MLPGPPVLLGLGSNIGDREAAIEGAISALERQGFRIGSRSSLYLTEPVGGPPQDWYLNAAVCGTTPLPPEELLEVCLLCERSSGRVRAAACGPRTLDVDLLLYGQEVRHTPQLSLPHPRLHQRRFVLVPLAEICPQARHPLLGSTMQELLLECADTSRVLRYAAQARA